MLIRIFLLSFVCLVFVVSSGIAQTLSKDQSYGATIATKNAVTSVPYGYRYFDVASIAAAGATYDTLRVVRDLDGNGVVDSVGVSKDYVPICRLDLWSMNAIGAACKDSVDIKWGNGATATDSTMVVFAMLTTTPVPAPVSFFVRADWVVLHSKVTVGAGDVSAIAYCER